MRTIFLDFTIVSEHFLGSMTQGDALAHRQSPCFELLQTGRVAGRQLTALQHANAVAKESKRSLRRDARIELAQRTRRRITRVSKHFSAGAARFFIDFFKPGLRKENLTTHLKTCRDILAMQLEGDSANGSHIGGNILAGGTVAAGRGLHQYAVFVENTHREAVELKLAAVGEIVSAFQAILYPLVEGEKALFIKHVVQRQHRHFMADLAEGS